MKFCVWEVNVKIAYCQKPLSAHHHRVVSLFYPGWYFSKSQLSRTFFFKILHDNVFVMILGTWVYDVFHVSPFFQQFLVMWSFLKERKLYLFINRGNRAIGAWLDSNSGKNKIQNSLMKKIQREFTLGNRSHPLQTWCFKEHKHRGAFGFCSFTVIV